MATDGFHRVLVVEDEPLIRMGVIDLCEAAGLIAEEAPNADEAIRLMSVRPTYSLLLTDIDMPGSMDGIALAWRAREAQPEIGVVVVSGKMVASQSILPPGSRFFSKPVQDTQLLSAIAEILKQRSA